MTTNYREQYIKWLKGTNLQDGTQKNYVNRIDTVSEIEQMEIFEKDDLSILERLYENLLKEQRNPKGKYSKVQTSFAYGEYRHYSAAIGNYIKFLKETLSTQSINIEKNNDNMELIKLLEANKNLILTGAPGTGKTYLAKQIAKQMIGIKTDKDLEQSGQFAFVQFHPSYDYTDFVEGLRPTKPDEKGNIGFELKDGVFKKFCKQALENLIDSRKSSEELQNKSNVEKTLDDFLTDAIENEIEFDYKNDTNKFIIIPHSREDYFYAKILNNESMERQIVAKKDVIKVLEKANEINKPTDINKIFNTKFRYQYTFMFLILERLRDKLKAKTIQSVIKIEKKDFIFIIDEINRGEISKIFGELFFSIDPSYRGKEGTIKMQYSNINEDQNENFYVPENIFIIGTMNDIDRSVESFDFAMRRRFTWEEITAEQSAKNMKLPNDTKSKMESLNKAISDIDGLNSSYHIGGAYFLDKDGKPRTDYNEIWELRLKSLLKEYLRGMFSTQKEFDDTLSKLKRAYDLIPEKNDSDTSEDNG
jgi:5-methylcytosine-specific restriction endonuclease McrBC GTP-binding regulatory subunit McrB